MLATGGRRVSWNVSAYCRAACGLAARAPRSREKARVGCSEDRFENAGEDQDDADDHPQGHPAHSAATGRPEITHGGYLRMHSNRSGRQWPGGLTRCVRRVQDGFGSSASGPHAAAMRSPRVAGLALILLVLGSGLAWLAPALDDALVRALHADRSTVLAQVARDATALGSHAVVLGLMLATGLIAWAARQPRLAVIAGLQGAGAMVLSFLLKTVVQRPRPEVGALDHLLTYAFPSGHALLAAAVWPWLGVLLAAREPAPRARAAYVASGLLLASVIAASRIVLGVHRPSEVVAGFGLGLGWGWLCARWAQPVGTGRL